MFHRYVSKTIATSKIKIFVVLLVCGLQPSTNNIIYNFITNKITRSFNMVLLGETNIDWSYWFHLVTPCQSFSLFCLWSNCMPKSTYLYNFIISFNFHSNVNIFLRNIWGYLVLPWSLGCVFLWRMLRIH